LSTSTDGPGLPVIGSIGVSVPSLRRSALFATQSVFKSHDGTTCCGFTPTLKAIHHLHRHRVDHRDVVRAPIRDIHAL
jgi:hypothetical protein